MTMRTRSEKRFAQRPAGRRLSLESLESRAVFSVTPTPDVFPPPPPDSGIDSPANFANLPQAAPAPYEQTFLLHSRPSASKVIYLDFDGHTTTGSIWNNYGGFGSSFVTPAFNFQGSGTTFTNAERDRIQNIWERVAEDYAPFDVDVTTEDPGIQNLLNTGGADTRWGVRVCIGGSYKDWYKGGAGGVAYLDTFGFPGYPGDPGFLTSDTPAFVFADTQYDRVDYIVLAATHEIGHVLGLEHDHQTTNGYYFGHGNWAPIMGAGYNKYITQWSKGEFVNSDNGEDDLEIITTGNGFGYRTDDYADTFNTATLGPPTGTTISAKGVIERNTDVDVLKIQPGIGPLSVTINPYLPDPNLDVKAELLDSTGAVIATADPTNSMAAKLTATITTTGPYYLRISNDGFGNPLTNGYSTYGSIGQYFITGTMALYVPPNPLLVTGLTATESAAGLVTGVRASFNYPVDRKTLTAANVKITGPGGAAVGLAAVKAVPGSLTDVDLLFAGQKITGEGGVRVALSSNVRSLAKINLDTDGDNTTGEVTQDFYSAVVHKFNSTPPVPLPVGDNATTDFPLTVDRAFNIRDLNVRVNLKHQAVGELELQLVSPDDTVIRLFNHRGLLGDNLTDIRFDEQAVKTLAPPAAAPFKGVFKPDFDVNTLDTLKTLNDTSSLGTWKLRVIDNATGMAGTLNSWGLTFTTNDARTPVTVTDITPINAAASAFANLTKSFTVTFSNDMNPLSVTTADFKVFNPKNAAVAVLSVKPVTGDPKSFTVTTAPWTKAGAYTIKVGPTVADTLGNSLDENGNGLFLEAADTRVFTKSVERNVYQSGPKHVVIPDGKSALTSVITIPDVISIDQIAIGLNIQHASLADLKITLISPPSPGFPTGTAFVLAAAGTLDGANLTTTTFTEEAAGPISGTGPYSGDFKPETSLAPLLGKSAKGTWKLKIEDTSLTGGLANKLLSWQIYVKPT